MLKVPAHIEKYDGCGFIAYTDKFNGFVVQSDTEEGVIREFVTSLIVKMAYDFDLSLENDITKNGDKFEVSVSKLVSRTSENQFEVALMS